MAAVTDTTASELRFRTAVEARDPDAVADAFAPDAVLRSPNTGSLDLRGREQITGLYRVIFSVFDDLRFTDELRGDGTAVLIAKARVDGTDLEVADHMRLDEEGRIQELTVFFRPLPAIAVASRAMGTALAARQSPAKARVVNLLSSLLVAQTRMMDKSANRMVGG
jgi:ketosteroid isomerase-like protein